MEIQFLFKTRIKIAFLMFETEIKYKYSDTIQLYKNLNGLPYKTKLKVSWKLCINFDCFLMLEHNGF